MSCFAAWHTGLNAITWRTCVHVWVVYVYTFQQLGLGGACRLPNALLSPLHPSTYWFLGPLDPEAFKRLVAFPGFFRAGHGCSLSIHLSEVSTFSDIFAHWMPVNDPNCYSCYMAHSLHVGCFPLCVQYTVHWWVPRSGCLDSQTACILRPQLINIQVSEIALFRFAWPLVGGSVSPVVWRLGCVGKFAEIDNSRNFRLVGFAWGRPLVAWSGRRFR